jgi:hypothetical protein
MVSATLEHQEHLVQSISAEYVVEPAPTPASSISAIQQILKDRHEESRFQNYIHDADFAKRGVYRSRWWREGVKERSDLYEGGEGQLPAPLSPGNRSTSFNGKLYTDINYSGTTPEASIFPLEGSHWPEEHRLTPNTLYTFGEEPLSKFVLRSPKVGKKSVTLEDGSAGSEISVADPDIKSRTLVFTFDSSQRLQSVRMNSSDGIRTDLVEEDVYSDYHSYTAGDGEKIWYPHAIEFRYFLGSDGSGNPVQYGKDTLKVQTIAFNQPIPSGTFDLAIPKDAKVWDGVGGGGAVNEQARRALDKTLAGLGEAENATVDASSLKHADGVLPASSTPQLTALAATSATRKLEWTLFLASVIAIASFLIGIFRARRSPRQEGR